MSIGLGSDFDLAESQTQLLTEGPSGESDIMAREATITHVSTSEDRVLQTSQEDVTYLLLETDTDIESCTANTPATSAITYECDNNTTPESQLMNTATTLGVEMGYRPSFKRATPAMLQRLPVRYRAKYTEIEAQAMKMDFELYRSKKQLLKSGAAVAKMKSEVKATKDRYHEVMEMHQLRCIQCPGCFLSAELEAVSTDLVGVENRIKLSEIEAAEMVGDVKESEKQNAWVKKERGADLG